MIAALILAAAAGAHDGHAGHTGQDAPPPATSAPATYDHHGHDTLTYWMVRIEAEYGRADDADVWGWDAEAWIGGDTSKFRLTSQGESHGGALETFEIEALYSVPISDFFEAKAGVRYDIEPEGRAYLTAGVFGLAPYFFETDAALYLSEDGDLSAQLSQEFDLLLSQTLVLTPEVALEAFAQDVPALGVGAGFSSVTAELTLRWEITRKFAPFVRLEYARALGETAGLARAAGRDVEESSLRAGLRVWF